MIRLDGEVVVITGATGALGHAVTSVFSKTGGTVIAVGREVPQDLPNSVIGLTADVTNAADVRELMTSVMKQTSRIDCLVNLVGTFAMGRLIETDPSVWEKMLATNLTSAFHLSRAVAPSMLNQGSGRIVHIAARAALDPFPGAAAYLVSKSALLSMIRVLAIELAGTGVTVNGVLPSTIDTPANRKNMPTADPSKWVTPNAVAQLLVFLASDHAASINGALIPIG